MIERNLGNLERLLRATAGIGLLIWAYIQPGLTLTEIFVIGVALMLVFNGIFSRCYVWFLLNFNTSKTENPTCARL